MEAYNTIDWTILAQIIDEGKCVLFLGPEATVNYGDQDRQNRFFRQLLDNYPGQLHSYHQEDGLFVFSEQQAIYNISVEVNRFYSNDYSSPMLSKLAQIPFHFIVLLTPDTSFQKEMERQGFAFNEDYYNRLAKHEPELPTRNTPPLFYHLLGSVKKTDTLIISHGQMYEYIRSFLGGAPLPQNIKTAINYQNAKNLIFLGVHFDKWYFQLMLNMLGVDANSYNSFASIQGGATGLRTIWEKCFRIHFVPHQIDEFVNKLHEAFGTNQLRKVTAVAVNRKYKNANLIKYFKAAFNATDLDSFCLSHFEEVYDDFTSNQEKGSRINKLLSYVRQQNEYDKLLAAMKDENPFQYEKNAPYYE